MLLLELFEEAPVTSPMSFWDIAEHYGIADSKNDLHDRSLPWINRNQPSCITRLSKSPVMRKLSQLMLWMKCIKGQDHYGKPIGTPAEFEAALNQPVKLWRGGGGTYDPDFNTGLPWTSFSASRKRMATFTQYRGTVAMKAWSLPRRIGPWWIVELEIPLRDILLYLPHGLDEEVIISTKDAARAKVVETGVGTSDD